VGKGKETKQNETKVASKAKQGKLALHVAKSATTERKLKMANKRSATTTRRKQSETISCYETKFRTEPSMNTLR